jgi:RTX calcium-binding nonapeptide repeat (4 copies)
MRAPLALALAVTCLAALPAAAFGSTAKVVIKDSCNGDLACSKYNGGTPLPIVTYVGASGESNRVAVARTGDVLTISDPGAAIAPAAPCQAIDAHQVTCTAGSGAVPISGFDAQLGDGDDTLAIAGSLGTASTLDGGPGSDTLTGGQEDDVLDGGPGADRLEGGAGEDVLDFSARSDGVVVDAASGRTSDGDSFTGLETVLGGAGADRLLGGPGPDVFRGGPGADVLRGAGGDDTLSGELGADSLDGGAGADLLDGDPPQGDGYYTPIVKLRRDILRGGSGNDQLSDTGGANVLTGGSGDDRLHGGVGSDRLLGGSGADALSGGRGIDGFSGGAGPDRISARDGLPERVACGGGRDIARVDAKDRVRACENLRPRRYTSQR